MYCPHCGKEVIEGAGFCAHCGNAVAPTAQVPQYTLTFVRYDADGPALTITMSTGESTTLADRDRQSISLPSGTHKFTLDAGTQHAEQEISLDADTQVNLYWMNNENRFLATLDAPSASAEESVSSPSVTEENKPAASVNEAWSAALAQVDRNRDFLAGILELSAACLLLFLPVVSIDSFVGSISVNLMKFSELVAGSLSYGATSFDNAMWGMLALVIPWIVIGCATISGIAALLKPSKISYTLYMNQSGPLGVLFALILYYITGNLMGFIPSVGLWLALGLSAGAWVAGWKNFQLVRAELKKVSRKLQK